MSKLMDLANETKAAYYDRDKALDDRRLFVHNLGVLLSQTRESVIGCTLDDHEIVHIAFKSHTDDTPYYIEVNVNMDSYCAIIKDVMKAIKL